MNTTITPAPADRRAHEGPSALIAFPALRTRGWTPAMVQELLGRPDQIAPNPFFEQGRGSWHYLAPRVEAAESTAHFARQRRLAQQAAAEAVALWDERLRRALEAICRKPIAVPRVEPAVLAQMAEGGPPDGEQRAVLHLVALIERGDTVLSALSRVPGGRSAGRSLYARVYDGIARTYPQLADECSRQAAALAARSAATRAGVASAHDHDPDARRAGHRAETEDAACPAHM